MTDQLLADLVEALRPVQGLCALVLGGSRGRGTEGPNSDYDIGLYYDPVTPMDIAALREAVRPLLDDPLAELTEIGEWGPWIIGGGWLTINQTKVDFLYRDLARVRETLAESREGRFTMNYQVGHPHGFCSTIWMGEIATCQPFYDPSGVIADLKRQTQPYPEALRRSLVARFAWEVGFAIENGELAAKRDEQTHVAGCAYRALCCMAQVLFAINRRYLINEKGAVTEAAVFPVTVEGLAGSADHVWESIGIGDHENALRQLRLVSDRLGVLVADTVASKP